MQQQTNHLQQIKYNTPKIIKKLRFSNTDSTQKLTTTTTVPQRVLQTSYQSRQSHQQNVDKDDSQFSFAPNQKQPTSLMNVPLQAKFSSRNLNRVCNTPHGYPSKNEAAFERRMTLSQRGSISNGSLTIGNNNSRNYFNSVGGGGGSSRTPTHRRVMTNQMDFFDQRNYPSYGYSSTIDFSNKGSYSRPQTPSQQKVKKFKIRDLQRNKSNRDFNKWFDGQQAVRWLDIHQLVKEASKRIDTLPSLIDNLNRSKRKQFNRNF